MMTEVGRHKLGGSTGVGKVVVYGAEVGKVQENRRKKKGKGKNMKKRQWRR